MNNIFSSHPYWSAFLSAVVVWGLFVIAVFSFDFKSVARDISAYLIYGLPIVITIISFAWKHSWKLSGLLLLGMILGMLVAFVICFKFGIGEFKHFRLF